jgi:mRNA interferase MazF
MAGLTYRRGDVVTCAPPGEFGKPRPAIVLQSDLFNETHSSVTVCPLTSERIGTPLFRVPVTATADNGLKKDSEAMADKLTTLRRDRIGAVIGRLDDLIVDQIDSAVLLWLGLRQ